MKNDRCQKYGLQEAMTLMYLQLAIQSKSQTKQLYFEYTACSWLCRNATENKQRWLSMLFVDYLFKLGKALPIDEWREKVIETLVNFDIKDCEFYVSELNLHRWDKLAVNRLFQYCQRKFNVQMVFA